MQVKVACPNCGKELKAPQQLWGKRVACPSCSQSFRVGNAEAPAPVAPGAGDFRVAPPPVDRRGQAARFIVDHAAETQLQLGADGRLPQLLFETPEAEVEQQKQETHDSNPLMLIGVLCFSVTLSVILLVFEPPESASSSAAQAQARAHIKQNYFGREGQVLPYQRLLRDAYSANDSAAERRLYREVLNRLKDDSLPPTGLTGAKIGENAPNDLDLETQLIILLSGDKP